MAAENPESDAPGFIDTTDRSSTNSVAKMDRTFKRDLPSMTPRGREWLKAALDPFHDTVESLQGYPDPKGGYSIQLCARKTITIERPKNLPTGRTWDCHIMNTGLLTEAEVQGVVIESDPSSTGAFMLNSSPPVNGGTFGTHTIVTEATGNPTAPNLDPGKNANFGSTTLEIHSLSPIATNIAAGPSYGTSIEDFLDGRARLNYCGVEVVNTTPRLYAGGAVCAYDQMGTPERMLFSHIDKDDAKTEVWVQTSAPSTVAEAMLMQGSRQWSAIKGAYQVSTFTTGDLPATQPVPASFCLMGNDMITGLRDTPPTPWGRGWAPRPVVGQAAFIKVAPLSGRGLYFTGLHADTTLQINVRYGIEMFPTQRDPIAMLASKPSPMYDPLAISTYQQIISAMPPGVPLDENFTGQWFGDVVNTIKKVAPIALNAISAASPDPRIKALATAGSALLESTKAKKATGPSATTSGTREKELEALVTALRAENSQLRAGMGPKGRGRRRG